MKMRTPNIDKLPSHARARPAVVPDGLHIAPCVECGCCNIHLSDDNLSPHNTGGGVCMNCGTEVTRNVALNPTPEELAAIWNGVNDIGTLIMEEEAKISSSVARIDWLRERAAAISAGKS